MYQTVNQYEFIESFDHIGRGNNFTREGRIALFEYLEDYETETSKEIELDPIGICCEFTEYETIADYNVDYGHFNFAECIEDIEAKTTVIRINDDAFIIQAF